MKSLRHLSTALSLALVCAAAAAHPASAAPAPATATPSPHRTMQLSADRIAFYYDRFLVEADGNVRLTTGDGLTVTGATMTMDLKNDRFMIAGGVHLDSPNGSQDGAALSDFMDLGRVYFVPISSEPDRWTFVDGDYTHPIKGREMPGDTFSFPDVSQNIPYLWAKSATIGEKDFVRFQGVVLDAGRARVLPVPTYYISFSADPHLAQNSLAGAVYDATWQVAGNRNSISAIHFRYDQINKTYLALEQHFASKKAYAVFSVNPLTRPSKFYNLVTDYQPGENLEFHTFTQFHTVQAGFKQPQEEQHVTSIRATRAFSNFSAALTYQTVNYCLLGTSDLKDATGTVLVTQACGKGPSLVGEPLSISHPQTWSLDLTSFDFPRRASAPVKLRLRGGLSYIHDNCDNYDPSLRKCVAALQVLGNTAYTDIYSTYVGGTIYSPSVKLGNKEDPRKTYFFNASLDAQRQWYSVPHHIDTIRGIASLSRVFNRAVAAYLSYDVRQLGDYYNEGQEIAYPSYVPVIGGVSFPGYAAFHGVATLRTLSLGVAYTPTPDFAFNLLARKHKDFPAPEFALFPPTTDGVVATYFLGQPPYDVTGDLRVRVLRHYYLDVQRTYYFNYGPLKWSPSFVIQVTQ